MDDLGGAGKTAGGERPDENRIGHFDERIIYVAEEEESNAFFHEPGERSAGGERAETASVSVRSFYIVAVFVLQGRAVGL